MDIRSLVTRLGYKVDTKGLKKGEKAISRYARNVKRIAIASVAAVGAAVVGIGIASVKTAAEMESINAAFVVMLGSSSKAKELIKDIEQLALETPFDFMDFSKSAKLMLNFGVAAGDVMGNLQMLGDIAGNDKERLRALSLAFSQTTSAGRLMGQDLLQMINAGFNPLQTMAKKTGKTMFALKKDMEKGAISADMVKEAFKGATVEGGRFYKNMETQSDTVAGQWSKFWGLIKKVRVEIGKKFMPTLKLGLKWINRFVEKKVVPALKKFGDEMRPIMDYVDYIVAGFRQLPGILKTLNAAFSPEISGIKEMFRLIKSIVIESIKLTWEFVKHDSLLKGIGWLFQKIYNILSQTIKGWLMLFGLLDKVLKRANRSDEERRIDDRRKSAKRSRRLFNIQEGFGVNKKGRAERRGKFLDEEGLKKFFADRRTFVLARLKKEGLEKKQDPILGPKEASILGPTEKPKDEFKNKTFTERMAAAMKAMKKQTAAIGEVAKARRETRIKNINLNVEQNVQIDAPAAKTGETGLSGQGLDAAMRKAQTALWTAQLNKLTTASIGS